MKAWLLDQMGDGIGKLHVAELSDPLPGPRQVVVDVQFAGLNPADRYLAENMYPAKPSFPHVLGRDGMGVVSAVGAGVSQWRVGQKVNVVTGQAGINVPGTFATKLLANADTLGAIPDGWTDEQAAAAPLVYCTAYKAIAHWGSEVKPNSVILITGATGGVGVAAVQLAKAMGHTVIALSRSAEKTAKLREIGADYTLDPNDPNWKKSLKEQLGKRRVDLAIDNIGGQLFNDLLDTLGFGGRITCVGRLAGPVPNLNTASLFFREIRVGGIAVHAYTVEQAQHAWNEVLTLLRRTGARPLIDSVHAFEKLSEAFARLERGPMGKVMLRIA
jgi:NADPH2:quinone reductase